ncbi:MAG: DHH family phosphoesterase, partial [Elusimicrobiota bacterium]|nr:DHH family phosphoesterase [Elusimicrobiota bacterium]
MKNKEKVWKYNYDDNNDLKEIIKKFSIYPKAASLLKNRGILNEKDIIKFLFGGLWHLHNPFLFEDMQKAVIRIRKAIDAKERILVYGDRDVDGISAVNIIVYTLKKAGANVWWYVPADEGCKIHKDILTQYAEENVKLLITVDCGIAANEEIEYAKTLGMDIIITDHHEPLHEGVPKSALAIINPKLEGTKYPFKNIAGCAVALKTAQAFTYTYNKEYGKTILLFSYDKDEIGDFVLLCNDLIIEKGKYKRFDELKELIKKSFRIYTFDNNAIQTILKKDILLKDKIIFCQIDNKDISSLILEKEKISCNDSSMKEFFDNNMDLCALGTIADAMPLIDENRIIVKEGLKILAQNPHRRQGLGLLIEDTLKAKHSYNITANSLSWNVTPVLNSAGRMGRGMLAVQLLMTKDSFQAQNLYNDIIKLNGERRILQLENIGQFKYLLKEQCSPET